jgi:hypothetical protein
MSYTYLGLQRLHTGFLRGAKHESLYLAFDLLPRQHDAAHSFGEQEAHLRGDTFRTFIPS